MTALESLIAELRCPECDGSSEEHPFYCACGRGCGTLVMSCEQCAQKQADALEAAEARTTPPAPMVLSESASTSALAVIAQQQQARAEAAEQRAETLRGALERTASVLADTYDVVCGNSNASQEDVYCEYYKASQEAERALKGEG